MKTRFVAVLCGLIIIPNGAALFAQDPTSPPQDPPATQQQFFSPEQLDSMVAPIALYPDSLLSQVLVASTYPLELVEADRWLQQNGNLQGEALIQAAQQQNWDPSIQALVPFPDVIKRLDSDIRWTTDLGNAFLAQQADVMDAVQRMRARARDAGKLVDTQQQRVVVEDQGGQSAIEIQPVDPQVIYVPVYNPAYFWGPPPPYYPWPGLFYPGIGVGWGWGFGIHVGFFFGGCCGWGGWGWGPGWFNHTVIVNNYFFHRYNYREFDSRSFQGNSVWAHDGAHRWGVPYPNRAVAERFRGEPGNVGGANFRGGERFNGNPNRAPNGAPAERFGNEQRGIAPRPPAEGQANRQPEQRNNFDQQRNNFGQPRNNLEQPRNNFGQRNNNHSAFGGVENGGRARFQSDHGFSSLGPQRTAPAFRGGGGGGGGGGAARAPAPSGGHAGGGRR
jgi:hypothetical protein